MAGDKVTLVDAEVPHDGEQLVLQADQSWPLQRGDRAQAYGVIYQRVSNYIRENGISRTVIKASAVSQGGMRKANLDAAELRGVVMAAAASVCQVRYIAKNHISRNFGNRKVDEYLADAAFWAGEIVGEMRVGSREAAIVLLAARAEG